MAEPIASEECFQALTLLTHIAEADNDPILGEAILRQSNCIEKMSHLCKSLNNIILDERQELLAISLIHSVAILLSFPSIRESLLEDPTLPCNALRLCSHMVTSNYANQIERTMQSPTRRFGGSTLNGSRCTFSSTRGSDEIQKSPVVDASWRLVAAVCNLIKPMYILSRPNAAERCSNVNRDYSYELPRFWQSAPDRTLGSAVATFLKGLRDCDSVDSAINILSGFSLAPNPKLTEELHQQALETIELLQNIDLRKN